MSVVGLYRLLLYLYPSDFRQDFGDEMLDTFASRLGDVDGVLSSAGVLLNELADGVWNGIVQRYQYRKQRYLSLSEEGQVLSQARWIVRVASVLNALFFVVVTVNPYFSEPTPENMVFGVIFTLQLVALLFALRWERVGSVIILTTTFTLATIVYQSFAFTGMAWVALMGAGLWSLPFVGFGLAYLVLGRRQVKLFS